MRYKGITKAMTNIVDNMLGRDATEKYVGEKKQIT